MWAILIVTLPSQPKAVRLRIWRSLKTLGCVALRDGAYLLPAAQAPVLDALAQEVRDHGGTASVLTLSPRDAAQEQAILAGFDRSSAYAAWQLTRQAVQAALPGLGETEARRRLRTLAEALQTLQGIDHYPGPASSQAQADLAGVRQALDAQFSKGEPRAAPGRIARLELPDFQGRRWASRARPWVDRLACAWLIARFIDRQAQFVWLADPALAPPDVLGFDYDGARFTHVGQRVSMEVLMASFGLDSDPALQRVAAVVHCLDAGGLPVPEAPGLEALLAGLREVHADDEALRRAAAGLFDALYASPPLTSFAP